MHGHYATYDRGDSAQINSQRSRDVKLRFLTMYVFDHDILTNSAQLPYSGKDSYGANFCIFV